MKLNKSGHAKFMYKKLIQNVKKLIKRITHLNSIILTNKIIIKLFFNFINKKGHEKTPSQVSVMKVIEGCS